MARRLPPLNALKAFEAAARHMSFLKAANELHVTAGAISQRIKNLEAQIGVALFRRLARGVVLTDAGQRYSRRIGELFEGIEKATRQLRQEAATTVLTISAMASFEVCWLIPRLGPFNASHPGVAVRVLPEQAPVDLASNGIDLAIRYGHGHYPELMVERLLPRRIFPVCSPKLMEGPHPIRTLADFAHHTLLGEEPYLHYEETTWKQWMTAVGADDIEVPAGPVFTFSHMALQAAVAGQGVALGTTVLAGDDLAAGRLVRPLPHIVESEHPYWLIYPPALAKQPRVRAFRDWIMAEATRFVEQTEKG
ncbi:MAG TPA: transcriptional regulator GcvA [Alphaproteobacteria bacterium]|nr:transcriptional regulator GcvA [Alphaproteobacteria bacterium]